MKKPGITTAATAALTALAATAALAAPAIGAQSKTVAFSARYAGTVTEKVSGNTVTAATRGTGSGKPVGKSTISGTVVATTAADQPCAPFGGPGVIAGAKGKLKVKVVKTSRGCAASEEQRNDISIAGTVTVAGGTKAFKKARGTLRFTGHYDRSSGAFTVKLTGKLKV